MVRQQPGRGRQLLSDGRSDRKPGTQRAAVLGSPVAHSLSPALHRAAYDALGLQGWEYGRHEVDEAGLAGFVEDLDASWRGLSLTMPLKEAAFEVADEVSETARRCRAINTLVPTPAGWVGDNTDVHGIVAALHAAGVGEPSTATVIGAGATARSALVALAQLGVRGEVVVAARDEEKGAALADEMTGLGLHLTVEHLPGWPHRPFPPGSVVISTLPAGGGNLAAAAPLPGPDAPVDAADQPLSEVTVLDVVYAGWPTPFASAALRAGATVVPGTAMLLHQAVRQVQLMTGRSVGPDVVAAMAAALPAL